MTYLCFSLVSLALTRVVHGYPAEIEFNPSYAIVKERSDPLPSESVSCGADRDRTDDIRLAKPALSQLSYSPGKSRLPPPPTAFLEGKVVGLGGLEPPTSRLSGVRSSQLSYRPLWSGPVDPKQHPKVSKNAGTLPWGRARPLKTK